MPQISTSKSIKTHNSLDTELTRTSTQLAITNGEEEKADQPDVDDELKKAKLEEERIKAHDIGYYTEKIHNKKVEVEDEHVKKMEMLKRLKKLVKK